MNEPVGQPFPSAEDLPDSEMEPGYPALQADSLSSESSSMIDDDKCYE